MPKQSQRKSFIIALLCLALISCGKHKKEESGEVSKGSLSAQSFGLTDEGSEDQNKEEDEKTIGSEGQEEELESEPAGTLVKNLTPAEIVQTQLNYGEQFVETPAKNDKKETNESQFKGEFKERKDNDDKEDKKEEKKDELKNTPGLIDNPFFQNQILADAFNAVNNSHIVELINLEQFDKSKRSEIIDNYFALLKNKDLTHYPLEKRYTDNLNLYSTNPMYAAAVKQKLNLDLSKVLNESEIAVFEPLTLNTEISREITGYPKPENGLGTYYIDNKDKEQEYTAIFIGQFIPKNTKAKKFSLTDEEKKNLDQMALLLKTYFESPITKPQDKLNISRYTTIADTNSEITTTIYAYLQEKWPAITTFTRTVGDDFKFVDPTYNMPANRIEILIESATSDYGAMMIEPTGTSSFKEVPNPNAGKKKFDPVKADENADQQEVKKDETDKQDIKKEENQTGQGAKEEEKKEDVKSDEDNKNSNASSEKSDGEEFDPNSLLNQNPLLSTSAEKDETGSFTQEENSPEYQELQDFLRDPLTYKTQLPQMNEQSKVEVASTDVNQKDNQQEALNLEKDQPEFMEDWDAQPEVKADSVSTKGDAAEGEEEENKYLKNLKEFFTLKKQPETTTEEQKQEDLQPEDAKKEEQLQNQEEQETQEEKESEEVMYIANPFQKDPINKILKGTFFAYEGTGADYNGLEYINLIETDEITPAQQQQVVDEYLRLMKERDPIEFLNELPLSERLTNTFDLYNLLPAIRSAIREQVKNQLYDIETKNGFKLTESELNIVVPLLYCFKINREISTDRFQKEISSQDELDVYETVDTKTKQKIRVIRLARFDFSENDKSTLSTREKNVVKNLDTVWTSVQNSAFGSSWTSLHPVIAGYSSKNMITLDSETEQNQEILAMAQKVKKSMPKALSFDIESRGTVNPLPGTKPTDKFNHRVEIVLLRTNVK